MDKFVFIQPPLTLGNPFLEDSFLRSCIYRLIPNNNSHVTDDLLRFGQRCITDLHAKATDAEINKPYLTQTNVYGKRVDEIHTTFGWKFQQQATANEGLISIPYPMITPKGTLVGLSDASQSPTTLADDHDVFSFTARLHAFTKNFMYTPSSGLFACPNAMTDGAALLLRSILSNPKLLGALSTPTETALLSPSSLRVDEQLLFKLITYCLSLLTNRSTLNPLDTFQPSLALLPPTLSHETRQHYDLVNNDRQHSQQLSHPIRPPFSTSGQWMTEQKSGSDVNYASTCLAFPLYSSSIPSHTSRLYSLYGLKWFTSAIDSKLTVTLARVITRDTWMMATAKLDKKYNTNRFSQLPIPSLLQNGGEVILDPNSINTRIYDNVIPFNNDIYGQHPSSSSSTNTNPNGLLSYFPHTHHNDRKNTIYHTDISSILDGIDPHSEVIRNIPLTCFLLLVKDDANQLNNIHIQRLKDKLGTRQLPTAELLLCGTLALRLSEFGRGIPLIAIMFNLTRIHNSISAIGFLSRLISVNRDYMLKRFVFGSLLSMNPTHINTMAKITSKSWLLTLSTLEISFLQGVSDSLSTMLHIMKSVEKQVTKRDDGGSATDSLKIEQCGSTLTLLQQRLGEIITHVYITLCIPFNPMSLGSTSSSTTAASSSHPIAFSTPQELASYVSSMQLPTTTSSFPSYVSVLLSVINHVNTPVSIILRTLTPLIKLCTAEESVDLCTQLMQLLGALGYMEDSNVPRNVRDVAVLSIWEGSTAVVSEDFIRAISVKHGVLNKTFVEFLFAVLLHRLLFVKQIITTPQFYQMCQQHPPQQQQQQQQKQQQDTTTIPSLFIHSTPSILDAIIHTLFIASKQLFEFLISPTTTPQQIILHSIAISRSVYRLFFMSSLLIHAMHYINHSQTKVEITPPSYIDMSASNYPSLNKDHHHHHHGTSSNPTQHHSKIVLSLPDDYGYRIIYAIYRLSIDTPYTTLAPQSSSSSPSSSSTTAYNRFQVVTSHLVSSELDGIMTMATPTAPPKAHNEPSTSSKLLSQFQSVMELVTTTSFPAPTSLIGKGRSGVERSQSMGNIHSTRVDGSSPLSHIDITNVIHEMNSVLAHDHVIGVDLNRIARTPL